MNRTDALVASILEGIDPMRSESIRAIRNAHQAKRAAEALRTYAEWQRTAASAYQYGDEFSAHRAESAARAVLDNCADLRKILNIVN